MLTIVHISSKAKLSFALSSAGRLWRGALSLSLLLTVMLLYQASAPAYEKRVPHVSKAPGNSQSAPRDRAGTGADQNESVKKLFDLIDALAASRPYKKEEIERIVGRTLNSEAIGYYSSDPVQGDIINHLNAPHGHDGSIQVVELFVNHPPSVTIAQVQGKFGKPVSVDRHPDYHEPENKKPVVYRFKNKNKVLEFEFEEASPPFLRAVSLF